MTMPVSVQSYLDDHHINYDLVSHAKTYTSIAAARAAEIDSNHVAKAVVLRGDKGYTMAVIPGGHWLRLKAIRKDLNQSLDLVSEEELETLFYDCEYGAIPILAEAYGIDVVMDDRLNSLADVYFECGDHEQLVHLRGDQFRQMMQGVRHGHYTH